MSQQSGPPQILQQTSMMAIVSLIGGLSFFFGIPIIGSVVAVVTGNMALKEIRQSNGLIVGENLARLGLVTGWFGITIWGIGILCTGIAMALGFGSAILAVCAAMFPFLSEMFKWLQQVPK